MKSCRHLAWPLMLAAATLLSGCYEGWDNPYGAGLPGSPTPTPPPPAIKPIAYILLQVVQMGADAIASDTCFPQSGIRQFKTTEWTDRTASILSGLQGIADTVILHSVNIGASDCVALSAVNAEAIKESPWAPDPSPEADTSGKPEYELVASYWEAEPSPTPPLTVSTKDWAGWSQLISEGRPAASLRYFVISNPINGYFTQWQNAFEAAAGSQVLDGTPINQVDPTSTGSTARDATIAADTQALLTWIEGKTP